jgi:hypothetical protein
VSPVKYELGFYIPEDEFFIVTAVKTSNLRITDRSLSADTTWITYRKTPAIFLRCRENVLVLYLSTVWGCLGP